MEEEVRVAANAAALSLCKAIEEAVNETNYISDLKEITEIVRATSELLSTITEM
ncbi:hypothetical protein [Paenibacillus elgii]|uniref:hypothetical protein n=1 Tax=Paenibacillus elgii TaxID=189691 RepID=UPI0013D34296|nr:hypothetical protein [Paenibacillus elgii]